MLSIGDYVIIKETANRNRGQLSSAKIGTTYIRNMPNNTVFKVIRLNSIHSSVLLHSMSSTISESVILSSSNSNVEIKNLQKISAVLKKEKGK